MPNLKWNSKKEISNVVNFIKESWILETRNNLSVFYFQDKNKIITFLKNKFPNTFRCKYLNRKKEIPSILKIAKSISFSINSKYHLFYYSQKELAKKFKIKQQAILKSIIKLKPMLDIEFIHIPVSNSNGWRKSIPKYSNGRNFLIPPILKNTLEILDKLFLNYLWREIVKEIKNNKKTKGFNLEEYFYTQIESYVQNNTIQDKYIQFLYTMNLNLKNKSKKTDKIIKEILNIYQKTKKKINVSKVKSNVLNFEKIETKWYKSLYILLN